MIARYANYCLGTRDEWVFAADVMIILIGIKVNQNPYSMSDKQKQ